MTGEPPLYVACLKLSGQPVLVAGGGPIAAGKAESLAACGASVTVVAPEIVPELERLVNASRVVWHDRTYRHDDLDDVFLAVAATDDPVLHAEIHAEAARRRIPVNVVDVPELCTFIVPALHRNGPFTIAISSAGASPALAKRLRDEIAETFGPAWGRLADRLRQERAWTREALPTYADRQRFFESIVLGEPDPVRLLEQPGGESALETLIAARKRDAVGADTA